MTNTQAVLAPPFTAQPPHICRPRRIILGATYLVTGGKGSWRRRHQISRRPQRLSPSLSQQVRRGRVDKHASDPGPTSISQPPAPCCPRRIIPGATYRVTSRRGYWRRRPKYRADREDVRHRFEIIRLLTVEQIAPVLIIRPPVPCRPRWIIPRAMESIPT